MYSRTIVRDAAEYVDALKAERDELRAENERLREALEEILGECERCGFFTEPVVTSSSYTTALCERLRQALAAAAEGGEG
jgi:hypothetical protein